MNVNVMKGVMRCGERLLGMVTSFAQVNKTVEQLAGQYVPKSIDSFLQALVWEESGGKALRKLTIHAPRVVLYSSIAAYVLALSPKL